MSTTSNETLRSLGAEEKSRASDYLASTRDALLKAVDGLSFEQWRFKPAADRWSIAEFVEHLAISEGRAPALIARLSEAPAAEPGRKDSDIDESILAAVSKLTKRFNAPPALQPTGQHSPEHFLRQFLDDRAHTIRLLEVAPFLRGRVLPHPVFGPLDGYQRILATAAHTARHTAQLLEVKAHPDFPKQAT
jgi:hypothetical protein